MWEIEEIPDIDLLFYRIHKTWFKDGELIPGVFRETSDKNVPNKIGMSTDWCKYSTSKECQSRAPKPEDNGIVSFIKKKIIELNLIVNHDPILDNQAHTLVKGINNNREEIRLNLLDIKVWEIPLNL